MKKGTIDLELEVKEDYTQHQKNTRGDLGPVCNNCGGFGFTLTIGGTGSAGCKDCHQTGVAAMTNHELQAMVVSMKSELQDLKRLIIELAQSKLTNGDTNNE